MQQMNKRWHPTKYHWLFAGIFCFFAPYLNLFLCGDQNEDFYVSVCCALLGAGLFEGALRLHGIVACLRLLSVAFRVLICFFGAFVIPFLIMPVSLYTLEPSVLNEWGLGILGVCYTIGLPSIACLPVHLAWRTLIAFHYLPAVWVTFFLVEISITQPC